MFNHIRNSVLKYRENTCGSFATIAAGGIGLLVLGAAISVETSNLMRSKNALQNALDAAVLSAASKSGSEQIKEQFGNSAFFSNLKLPCTANPVYSFSPNTVNAVNRCEIPALFAGAIGVGKFELVTESEATFANKPVFMCLHSLNYSAQRALTYNNKRGPLKYVGDSIIAPECAVQVNSSSSSALFIKEDEGYTFAKHCIYGGVRGDVSQITPPPDATCKERLPDPLNSWSTPVAPACGTNLFSNSGSTVTLNPGHYCSGFSAVSGSITMNPGIYHFTNGGLTLEASNSITGNGVTIVMHPSSGAISMEAEGEINLSSPTVGQTRGFLIVDRNNSSNDHLIKTSKNDTSAMYLDGIIYTPQDLMEIFWKRAGVGANEKMLHFTNFGVIADTIDLHGYNQLRIDIPQDAAFLSSLFSMNSSVDAVRLSK